MEYKTGEVLGALREIFLYEYICENKKVTYDILELSSVCAKEMGKLKTQTYLSDLQNLAKLTGQDYSVVLNGVMSLLGQSVTELHSTAAQAETPQEDNDSESETPVVGLKVKPDPFTGYTPRARLPAMSPPRLNPPEVQRYVVEHIMKNEDSSMMQHSVQRLRAFSGRSPRPQNESDYDIWCSGVELLLKDPAVSDLQRSRKIFESLLPPAADMVKHLKPDTPPIVYLQILDSVYGTVQDGDELHAKFMDTFKMQERSRPCTYNVYRLP